MQHLSYFSDHFDLVSPDGKIISLTRLDSKNIQILVFFERISQFFVGFDLPPSQIIFNLKSTIAQLGIDASLKKLDLNKKLLAGEALIQLFAVDPLGEAFLKFLSIEAYVGKLFACDERRRVKNPDYLSRLFGRVDRFGRPLISLGGHLGSQNLILEKIKDKTVAFLSLKPGRCMYLDSIHGFLPTIAKSLCFRHLGIREYLQLHQYLNPQQERIAKEGELLLVQTEPLHIRTVFAKIAEELLPTGYQHTQACILQPNTYASGNIYEFYGRSQDHVQDIPLEFYTLEPYREHVSFQDRDQLRNALSESQVLFDAFKTAPESRDVKCATFVVKSQQLLQLKPSDWISEETPFGHFPGIFHAERQAKMVQEYVEKQASYPYLKAMLDGNITSEGILLSRYFPSPLMKRLLLSDVVFYFLKRIYFEEPSKRNGDYFTQEDRTLLLDLAKFGIPVFWVDKRSNNILQFITREDKAAGMFVPTKRGEIFYNATAIGVYGSHLIPGGYEKEIYNLFKGLLKLKEEVNHPLLNPNKPLILVTGGGPGAMEMANQIAKELGILSCANIVDFRRQSTRESLVEQEQNPYVEAKMTYKTEFLVERQAEFLLNLPIFVIGGIGTDFEFALEEVRRKVEVVDPTPVLLFGSPDYWKAKISSRFQINYSAGVIKGSEWISNCFYCIQSAEQGLSVYRDFFTGKLSIGPKGPIYEDGFKIVL
jgi:predicted Rossmann-fold nucleotide-binding protein